MANVKKTADGVGGKASCFKSNTQPSHVLAAKYTTAKPKMFITKPVTIFK
jgi:hypothetical protein